MKLIDVTEKFKTQDDCRAEEISGLLPGFRSYHWEDYRIIYRPYEDLKAVAIVGIGKKNSDHFAEIYKRLEQMAGAGKLADSFLRNLRGAIPQRTN